MSGFRQTKASRNIRGPPVALNSLVFHQDTPPMVLEYDWKSDAYRSRFDDPFPMIEQSFETLAAARLALRLVGLRLGAKTDPRTWWVEYIEPVASAPTPSVWEVGPTGIDERIKRPDPLACRQNG
jgi:hypothetical protein